MSKHVKAALLATKDLGKNERLVVLAIAAHMNTEGDSWPSVPTIAEYVGCSERTVQRCLAKLITMGRVAARWVAGRVTRTYRLLIDGVSSAIKGATDRAGRTSDRATGGDSQEVSPEGVEDLEGEKRPGSAPRDENGRLAWWQYKRPKPDPQQRPSYPQRRGAALPPPAAVARCQKRGHEGQPLHNCGPCRSEQNGGGAR